MDAGAAAGTYQELTQPIGPCRRRRRRRRELDALLGFERKALARRQHLEDVSHGGPVVDQVLRRGESLVDGGGDPSGGGGHPRHLPGFGRGFLVLHRAGGGGRDFATLASLLPLLLALPQPLSLRRSLQRSLRRGLLRLRRGRSLVAGLCRGGGCFRVELLRGGLLLWRPQKFSRRLHPPLVLVQDGLQLRDARHDRGQLLALLHELLDDVGSRPLLGVRRGLKDAGGLLLCRHAVVKAHRGVNLLAPLVDLLEPARELVPQLLVHVVGVDVLGSLAQVLEDLQLG
mmetsp:Transcript_12772/g.49831  ORF Transcript_12772/g.49831 Transcript_12772/m.49831 type:complete len:286 (+) Transcript_12772:4062-4919(+)